MKDLLHKEFDKLLLFLLVLMATGAMLFMWSKGDKDIAITMQRVADSVTGALIAIVTGRVATNAVVQNAPEQKEQK